MLPDGLRLFDRLSGSELVRYTGRLRGVALTALDTRIAVGPVAQARGNSTLQQRFIELVGVQAPVPGVLDWLDASRPT